MCYMLFVFLFLGMVCSIVGHMDKLEKMPFLTYISMLFFKFGYGLCLIIAALILYHNGDTIFKGVVTKMENIINVEDTTQVIEVPVDSLPSMIEETELVSSNHGTFYVTLTCYNPVASQCQGDPLVTASTDKIDLQKLKAKKLKWCAISHDLRGKLPWGSVVEIDGYGQYIVKDAMNSRFSKRMDILQAEGEPLIFKKNVKVTIISVPKNKKNYAEVQKYRHTA